MIGMNNGLHSKNTPIPTSPMTSQNPCISPYCQLNSTCSSAPKIGRLWHNATYPHPQPSDRTYSLSFPDIILMRHNCDSSICLRQTDLKSVTYCIFLRKPHGTCCCSYPHSNPLKCYRCNYPHNYPWTYFVPTILPSKFKLQANPLLNHITLSKTSNITSTNNLLMTHSKSHQPCPTCHY